jgi:hypothetical protein
MFGLGDFSISKRIEPARRLEKSFDYLGKIGHEEIS